MTDENNSDSGEDHNDQNRQDFLHGQLLIAMPNLRDGCFRESVVLICSHDQDHAMGLILNKTISDLTFSDLLQQVKLKPSDDIDERPIHFGGPVDTKRGAVLHTDDYRHEDTIDIVPGVCLTASREILEDLNEPDGRMLAGRNAPSRALICAGHAGWSAGQLEHELAQNAWLNIPGDPELIFADDPDTVWDKALAKFGIDKSMFSQAWSEVRSPDTPLN